VNLSRNWFFELINKPNLAFNLLETFVDYVPRLLKTISIKLIVNISHMDKEKT